jgi:bifunctional non-homologous end joining protein LigD
MRVEDHPLDYGSFEGVIPEGYGAGIVMLWDTGRWWPETDDVDAALERGELKFRLDGYKLKGSWVLVRTGGRMGPPGRSWLLIKHRDEWSGEIDIVTFAPLSVKSSGDFADILAADAPNVWTSDRPARGGQAGEMLRQIIERAAEIRAARPSGRRRPSAGAAPKQPRKAPATRRTPAASTAARKRKPSKALKRASRR